MKILVINHSNNYVYGASKSLQSLLTNLDIEYDLVSPKSLLHKHNADTIRKHFKGKLNHIYSYWLPSKIYIYGRESRSIKGRLYHVFLNIMYYSNYKKLQKLCQNKSYDFIYLNSTILFPMINKNSRYIIHIREMFKGNDKEFYSLESKLKQATGVVFIDQASYQPFSHSGLHYIILSNPFDMRTLNTLNSDNIAKKYDISENVVVFSILGKMIKLKGVDFVIKAFMNVDNVNAILIIVGDKNGGNAEECIELAHKNPNIKFIGELQNPDEIYKISDYIVRGDQVVALGRTTYEGLYATCDVILPSKDGKNHFVELSEFTNKCHTYKVNDLDSLTSVLISCASKKVKKGEASSNIDSYITDFNSFINSL